MAPQREKMLFLTMGKQVAMKLCTRGCIEITWLSSEPVFECFFGVLRGERKCCCMLGVAIIDQQRKQSAMTPVLYIACSTDLYTNNRTFGLCPRI